MSTIKATAGLACMAIALFVVPFAWVSMVSGILWFKFIPAAFIIGLIALGLFLIFNRRSPFSRLAKMLITILIPRTTNHALAYFLGLGLLGTFCHAAWAVPRRIRIFLLAVVVIFMLAFVSLIFFTSGRTPASPPLPNPNGYDDLLKATALLTGDVGNAASLDADGLRALMAANAEPLRLIRLGLSRSCSVPTDSAMTNIIAGAGGDFAGLKSLARLVAEEGRLAEKESRYGDAAHSYIEVIRLGNEMSRGGFLINRLVGIACEAIGQTSLSKLVPKLKPEEIHPLVAELEKIDNAGVTWKEVRQNENRFARYELRKGFNPIALVMAGWQGWQARQRAEMRHNRIAAKVRLLTVELALRCYQIEQGRAPGGLEQLVPKYLQRLPSDPFSGRSMVYRARGTNWLLYSVGEDCVDDGGKPVARSVSGTVTRGDLLYDSPY